MRGSGIKSGITDPVDISATLSRLVRIEALGNIVSHLCQSESLQPDLGDMSELGKMISEEAGIIICHMEGEPNIVKPTF